MHDALPRQGHPPEGPSDDTTYPARHFAGDLAGRLRRFRAGRGAAAVAGRRFGRRRHRSRPASSRRPRRRPACRAWRSISRQIDAAHRGLPDARRHRALPGAARRARPAPMSAQTSRERAGPSRPGRIIVLDDEAEIRNMLERFLALASASRWRNRQEWPASWRWFLERHPLRPADPRRDDMPGERRPVDLPPAGRAGRDGCRS